MSTYNKILIVGGIGSGKTTLARKLSKLLKIRNYELDNIAYKRREIYEKYPPEIRDKKVKLLLKRKKWIIEGFYSRTWTHKIHKKADIIIILNVKTSVSKSRLIRRFIKRKLSLKKSNRNRKFKRTLSLIRYINDYPKKYFQMQKKTAKKFNKNVLILKDKKQIKKFVGSLK